MIIADTSGLLAFFNRREPRHFEVAEVIAAERDPIVVPPYVVAELDYLVGTRIGTDAEVAVLAELTSGAYHLATIGDDDLRRCAEVIDRYADQGIGVADASIVVLADRVGTRTVLTLDRRHFETLRPISGGRFKLVP